MLQVPHQNRSTHSSAHSDATATTNTALAMEYEQAFDYVKAKREKINPNLGFVLALRDLEERLRCTIGGGCPTNTSGMNTPRSHHSTASFSPQEENSENNNNNCNYSNKGGNVAHDFAKSCFASTAGSDTKK